MRVGVGFSDNPDSSAAGTQAAKMALLNAGVTEPCDMALVFVTSHHDPETFQKSLMGVIGPQAAVVGGGAVGSITNADFGYAGDQAGVALFWFEDCKCDIVAEPGLRDGEEETGFRLGKKMLDAGVGPDSPVFLFYDAIDRTGGGMRLLLASPLLAGIEKSMGFFPNLVGAGLQGDFVCTPIRQWTGKGLDSHSAVAMAFSGKVRLDSAILHGCRPATGYYTVTRSEGQTILEINGQPALGFVQSILGPGISPEEYAFFLIFGINRGDQWGDFDEKYYANRLCLAIDKDRGGIVMFEPDMVPGTRFQIMHRSLDLGYIAPRIEELFERARKSRPVFAFYIDCAGRAAGYAGTELEDAVTVQEAVAGRVPLLGIYSGVEIAPVIGKPRTLDWTGVFCLLSVTP